MAASRNLDNMKRYKRKRSGFDTFKYFILEHRFILILIAAAVVVVILFFFPGVLINHSNHTPVQTIPPVVTAAPTATPTPSATPTATATPQPSASASAVAFTRVLKYTKPNMQGDDVWALQEKLGLKPDGYFGKSTEDAVIKFQLKHGLTGDGIVGDTTLVKLGLK